MKRAKSIKTSRVKMADIAALANVSISTVSRALVDSPDIADDLKDKIRGIADAHGYVVNQAARSLRSQSTRTIGLILPMGHETGQQISDPFLLEFIGCLAEEVISRRYDILLSKVPEPEPNWLGNLVQSHRFDGLLVIGQSDQHAAINALASKYEPLVVWGERMKDQAYCSVGVDNVMGGRMAAEHVIEAGSRDPLFLGPKHVPEVDARQRGFLDALANANINPKADPFVETHFTYESAYEVASDLIRSKRKFDGLVCASDVIAYAAMKALEDAGIAVPDQVNVCGFDDVSLARTLTPPLTTIRQDLKMGARFMVSLLFDRMEGKKSSSAVIPASLIIRRSTRPIG